MDFERLRSLPGTTQEEFDQLREGILALAREPEEDMKRICGVCGEPITRLVGDAKELQQELSVDLSAFIRESEPESSHTEYVCRQCVLERTDDVLRFLAEAEVTE